jgi:hypothetical protein
VVLEASMFGPAVAVAGRPDPPGEPLAPTTETVLPLRAQAVRKLGEILRLVEQSEICHDFFASKRSEDSKKRTK